MRAPHSDRHSSVGANMTPMIDVVFLLIIFFLVSSHLARQETRLPMELPTAVTHDPIDLEKITLTISVDAEARVLVAGKPVDDVSLRRILDDWMARMGSGAAVRIRCEGKIAYRHVEPVLRQAALAGITDAAIAVKREAGR